MLNMEIEEYILFVDSLMEQICATLWGDGVGITPSQAARVVIVPADLTTNKKTVTSFDEFQYFINTKTMQGGGLTEVNAAGAFTNCTALTSITLPDSLGLIGAGTFKGCTSLDITNEELSNVTTIGVGAFTGGLSATSTFELDCPNLTSIGRGAFMNSNIYKVNNLGKITTLTGGNIHGVFYNCPRLVSASLPSTLTSLGPHCFEKCYSLTSIPGIENVVTFKEACLAGVPLSGELHLTNAQTIGTYLWQRTGTVKHATITKVYLPSIVTLANGTGTAGSGVFDRMDTLEEVYLGNNCNQIGTAAFRNCSALTKCDLPSSITILGQNVFYNDTLLEGEINLPNLTSLGINAFAKCSSITKVKSLGSITSIAGDNSNGTFRDCSGLTEVVLPNTLTSIGVNVLRGCSNLTKCDIPSSVTTIDNYAFYDDQLLEGEIDLPNLTTLRASVFYNCRSLTKVKSLGSITTIQSDNSYGEFRNCTGLTEVVLPNTLTSIGNNAFHSCTGLVTCSLPQSLTSIGNASFYNCTSLTGELNLPNLTSLGIQVFVKTAITKIKSLGNITTIPGTSYPTDGGTFHDCKSLTEATLPSTLTSIGTNTFRGCSNLETLIVLATTPPSAGDQFLTGTPATLKIYVPYSADHSILAAYQSATRWSSYASKMLELDANGNIPT